MVKEVVSHISIAYYKVFGTEFIIGSFEDKLCLLDYRYRRNREMIDKRLQKLSKAEYKLEENALLSQTRRELDEYFKGERKTFTLPLIMFGSEFQKSVWNALLEIPYSQTVSYLELSRAIKNEKAVRAVANANGANAMSIVIPCHRVIGSNGTLTGYAGGLEIKKSLLELENI